LFSIRCLPLLNLALYQRCRSVSKEAKQRENSRQHEFIPDAWTRAEAFPLRSAEMVKHKCQQQQQSSFLKLSKAERTTPKRTGKAMGVGGVGGVGAAVDGGDWSGNSPANA
jgi:hypothetical protein